MSTITRPYTVEDVADLQSDARNQRTKLDAVTHLHEHYPHCSPRFLARHLKTLVSMDPAQLVRFIGYPDPVAEHAVNRVIRERGY